MFKRLGNGMYIIHNLSEVRECVADLISRYPFRAHESREAIDDRINKRGIAMEYPITQYPQIISIDLRNTIMVKCSAFPDATTCLAIHQGNTAAHNKVVRTEFDYNLSTNEVIVSRFHAWHTEKTNYFMHTITRKTALGMLKLPEQSEITNARLQVILHNLGYNGQVLIEKCPSGNWLQIHRKILELLPATNLEDFDTYHKARKLMHKAIQSTDGSNSVWFTYAPTVTRSLREVK